MLQARDIEAHEPFLIIEPGDDEGEKGEVLHAKAHPSGPNRRMIHAFRMKDGPSEVIEIPGARSVIAAEEISSQDLENGDVFIPEPAEEWERGDDGITGIFEVCGLLKKQGAGFILIASRLKWPEKKGCHDTIQMRADRRVIRIPFSKEL